jgi:hypothetical protein
VEVTGGVSGMRRKKKEDGLLHCMGPACWSRTEAVRWPSSRWTG